MTTYHPKYLATFFKANTHVFQHFTSQKINVLHIYLSEKVYCRNCLVIKLWICSNCGHVSYQQGSSLCKHTFQQWSFVINTAFSKGQGVMLTRVKWSFIASAALKASPNQWWLQMSLNVQQQKILQAMNFDCSAHKRLQAIWKRNFKCPLILLEGCYSRSWMHCTGDVLY